MSPKPDVSEKRKKQIINAAQKVFSELGFHEARMSDIAEESGLSKGTLYLYFESKDEIILNLLDKLFETELRALRKLIDQDASAEDRVLQYTERVIDDMVSMQAWMPIAFEFISLAFHRETVQEVLRSYFQEHMKTVKAIVAQGCQRGEFKDIDPEEAAIALGAVLEGTPLLWVYDQKTVDIPSHIRSGVHLILNGLKSGTGE
ncbi:MAG: TetR/AcrR family transcriptional regulator [Anaerolineales bacterium]